MNYFKGKQFSWALADFKDAKKLDSKNKHPNIPSYITRIECILEQNLENDLSKEEFWTIRPWFEFPINVIEDLSGHDEILDAVEESNLPEESFEKALQVINNIRNKGNLAFNDGRKERAYDYYLLACKFYDCLALEFIDNYDENEYNKSDEVRIQTALIKNEIPCRLRLADMQIEKGLFKSALHHCNVVAGEKYCKMVVEANLRATICYLNTNDYPLAMGCVEDAEEAAPKNKDVFDMRKKVKEAIKSAKEKIEECTNLLKIEKANIKVLMTRAQCSLALGYEPNLKSSFQDFVHVLKLDPTVMKARDFIQEIKKRLKDSNIKEPEIEAYDPFHFDSSSSEEDTEYSEEETEEPEIEFHEVVMHHLGEKFPTASSQKLDFYYDKTISTQYEDDQFVRASEVIAKVTEVMTEAEEDGFSDFEWHIVTEEVLKKYPNKDISDLEEHVDDMKANFKPPLNHALVICELAKRYQEEVDRLQNENYSTNHFARAVVASMKEDDIDKYGSTKTFKLVFMELQKDYPFRSRLEIWVCFKELWKELTRETYPKLLLTKFVELCKRVFELQDEAWKERVQPLKEKKEDALIIENVVDHVKHFHPHVPDDEIKARTEHVIALKRREKKCGDDLESRIKQIVQLPFESRPSLSPSQWAHLL